VSITAPLEVELQHDDINVIDDELLIVSDVAPAGATIDAGRDPLVPFLVLGIITLIAVLVTATLLAF